VSSQWRSWGDDTNATAIVDGSTGLSRTYREHLSTTTGLAQAFWDMGVTQNSTVALCSPNHVDYLPVALAASVLGAKITPINPLYTRSELEMVLGKSRSSVLVCPRFVDPAVHRAAGRGRPRGCPRAWGEAREVLIDEFINGFIVNQC
jgi:acyl-CoA synthetase (AMP-forming)/AMP-acid ligase II